MRHLRMVGLSLVAVFAIAAVTATSASALPEWGKCEAKAGGKYSDSNCTVKAKKGGGTFEWTKGKDLAPVKFTGKNVGSGGVLTTFLRTCSIEGEGAGQRWTRKKCEEEGGVDAEAGLTVKVECESETSSGQAEGTNKVSNVLVTFKGCTAFGAGPCTSAGAAEGEVKVNPLKGKLGYISKPKKEAGVLLEPAKHHGHFADFVCLGFLKTVVGVGNSKEGAQYLPESTGGYDGIISPITPVNTMTTKYTQVYTTNEATNENIPAKFEGKHIELLEDYVENLENSEGTDWSAAGEEITNENTPAEAGEIKA